MAVADCGMQVCQSKKDEGSLLVHWSTMEAVMSAFPRIEYHGFARESTLKFARNETNDVWDGSLLLLLHPQGRTQLCYTWESMSS